RPRPSPSRTASPTTTNCTTHGSRDRSTATRTSPTRSRSIRVTRPPPSRRPDPVVTKELASRGLLTLAAVAIGFAAADTYVVVLALPDMMTAAGLTVDDLQRAAPIISGFLLGYVAV